MDNEKKCDCENPPPDDWDGKDGVYHVSNSCPIHNEFPQEPEEEEIEELYYVQDKRNFVGNCMLFWGLNDNGYVCDIRKAQKYTKERAERMCNNRETDVMWPVEYIHNRISQHIDMQDCKHEDTI